MIAHSCGASYRWGMAKHAITNHHRVDGLTLREADTAFAVLLLTHFILWTMLPTLFANNLPLDVVEALAWGREWQMGHHKHPPLSAWLAESVRIGDSHWPLFLLSQLMVAGAFLCAWLIARDVLSPARALIAVSAMAVVHYHTFSSVEFNANVVQYPFWGLAALAFWRGVRGGGNGWWVALGVAVGLGALGKYSFLLLPASMGMWLLLDPRGRKLLGTAGPWLAGATALAVLTPHILWSLEHGFPALTYASERGGGQERAIGREVLGLLGFLGAQMLAMLPLLGVLLLAGRPTERYSGSPMERRLLLTIALGPVVGFAAAALLLGIALRDMWGATLFLVAGPVLMVFLAPDVLTTRRFARALAILVGLSATGYAVAALIGPRITGQWERIHFPGAALTREVEAAWEARFSEPLDIVIGDVWLAGNIGFYAQSARPSAFIDANPVASPWLDDESVRARGAVVLWASDRRGRQAITLAQSHLSDLPARFPGLVELEPVVVDARWLGGGAPFTAGIAVIPPAATNGDPDATPPAPDATIPGSPGGGAPAR